MKESRKRSEKSYPPIISPPVRPVFMLLQRHYTL
nr:MAG TPA_asm: hypothetical protein [Caudoviricetes sp.]